MAHHRSKLVLLATVALCLTSCQAVVRLCIPQPSGDAGACAAVLNGISSGQVTWSCVYGGTALGCQTMIASSQADLARMGGDQLFLANTQSQLQPFVSEAYGTSEVEAQAQYYSVAVVKKSFCDALGTGARISALKNRRSCHTGYRRTAGWTLPVGYLISQNIMPVVDRQASLQQDAETVSAFFSQVCAPGTTSQGPTANGGKYNGLCEACKGDCSDTAAEQYVGYDGALRCMMEGAGDVAWVKHTTPLEYALDGTTPAVGWSTILRRDEMRLMCPSGGCVPVDQWQSCNLARAPAHAFVGRPGYGGTPEGQLAVQVLAGANTSALTALKSFGAPTAPIVQSSAVTLRQVANPGDFINYFGASTYAAFTSIRNLQVPTVRICTTSPTEQTFCTVQLTPIMNIKNVGVTFTCVEKVSEEACLEAIKLGQADMVAVDGGDIYRGLVDHNLKAIVAENYGTVDGAAGTSYYAVAVLRKSFCDKYPGLDFMGLMGERSCGTGYRRSAGFSMPLGFMINNGYMSIVREEPDIEDDAETYARFFYGNVCVPRTSDNGPKNSADGKGTRWDHMCKLCKGDCSGDPEMEPYNDYSGALRCLMDNRGDVAWVKHTTPLDFARDGRTPQPWSSVDTSDLRLLCPTGGCAPISQASRCNIASVPSHTVMVRADYPETQTLKAALVTLGADADFKNVVFNTATNPGDLVFKSSTQNFVTIDDDTRSFLGSAVGIYESLDVLNSGLNPEGYVPGRFSSSGGHSNRLSGGEVAGVAIGCAIGGGLIAALLMVFIQRRRTAAAQWDRFSSSAAPQDPAVGISKV